MSVGLERNELIDWIRLAEAIGRSGTVFRKLVGHFTHPAELFGADEETLRAIPELTENNVRALRSGDPAGAIAILEACERLGIRILPYGDDDFPRILREIPDPPPLLYYVGTLPDFANTFCVGMVGTRKMTESGLENGYRLAYELASAQALVISGLAEGIDGVCAVGAMEGGGKTVAVIGCGLDIAYPRHHGKLMNRIVDSGGAIFSEYPPGTRPMHYHFPIRNRIISGLSQVVIVVEAGAASGSLITAREAVTQGRKVFAVPADAEAEEAAGNNQLLRDGASVVLEAQDLVDRYRYVFDTRPLAEKVRPLVGGADREVLKRCGVIAWDRPERENPAKRQPVGNGLPQGNEPHVSSAPSAKQPPETAETKMPDEVLQSLTPVQRAVLEAMPDDIPVTSESIRTEYPFGEVLAALTMLEILGIVRKLPGSMYGKV